MQLKEARIPGRSEVQRCELMLGAAFSPMCLPVCKWRSRCAELSAVSQTCRDRNCSSGLPWKRGHGKYLGFQFGALKGCIQGVKADWKCQHLLADT